MKRTSQMFNPSTSLRGIHLIQDNAATHKSTQVQSFLGDKKVVPIDYPTYVPDLSLCDFFLFPRLKKSLAGCKHLSNAALGNDICQLLKTIPRADDSGAFKSWISRLQKSIQVKEEYFEVLTWNTKNLLASEQNYSTIVKTFRIALVWVSHV